MSTDLASELLRLDNGMRLLPLVAVDGGRFEGVDSFDSSLFPDCQLPQETHAGLLLYAGFAARCHAIAQNLNTREGHYWHGIYHRLEPDDWNAKYWLKKVGSHPINEILSTEAGKLGWNHGRNWDHSRFVDFFSEARVKASGPEHHLAQQIQMIEWRLLFEFCSTEGKK